MKSTYITDVGDDYYRVTTFDGDSQFSRWIYLDDVVWC